MFVRLAAKFKNAFSYAAGRAAKFLFRFVQGHALPPGSSVEIVASGCKIMPAGYEMVLGPLTYNQDGLATVHNCDFMKDARFLEAYEAGKKLGSWHPLEVHWRAYVLCWAAEKGSKLEGDFVECGVHFGSSAMCVAKYLDFRSSRKKFYLLDTFCGLDRRYVTQEEISLGSPLNAYSEDYYERVKQAFADYPNVELVRGAVPDTLGEVKSRKVAFLALDMNSAWPEVAAADFFWDRLVSGAAVVLDDYGWSGYHAVQKRAFDEFAQRKGVAVLPLPTGQGIIFKP